MTLCKAARSSSEMSGFGTPCLTSSGSLGDSATALILSRAEQRWACATEWRSRDYTEPVSLALTISSEKTVGEDFGSGMRECGNVHL